LPSPAPHELIVDLGPTLLLALGGVYALRTRVAPFGILMWLLVGTIAMYLPVPYQRRLGFGLHPALCVVAGNALIAACDGLSERHAAWLRHTVFALAPTATLLILAGLSYSSVMNWPMPVYRSTTDLDAAVRWLDRQARPGEAILAEWDVSKLRRATHTRARGGRSPGRHARRRGQEDAHRDLFAHTASRQVAQQYGAQWLIYGPREADLPGPPDPAFQSGDVRVYRVDRP
jgi:hypothetical protein